MEALTSIIEQLQGEYNEMKKLLQQQTIVQSGLDVLLNASQSEPTPSTHPKEDIAHAVPLFPFNGELASFKKCPRCKKEWPIQTSSFFSLSLSVSDDTKGIVSPSSLYLALNLSSLPTFLNSSTKSMYLAAKLQDYFKEQSISDFECDGYHLF